MTVRIRIYKCVCSLFVGSVLTVAASAQDPASVRVSVTTYQDDTYRTGQNLNGGSLVKSGNSIPNLHKLCASQQLDGQVYAQPLVVTSVSINGTYY